MEKPAPARYATSATGGHDPRLAERLAPSTLAAVQEQIDSANKAKLPGSILADKALELQARGVQDPDIVDGVRGLRGNLTMARASLGEGSTPTELSAGTSAIDAGTSGSELALVRAAGAKRPLDTPLIVLSDLIAAQVPVGKSADLVVSMLKAGVRDADFLKFQKDVRADISHGATDPAVVATARAKGAIDRVPKPK